MKNANHIPAIALTAAAAICGYAIATASGGAELVLSHYGHEGFDGGALGLLGAGVGLSAAVAAWVAPSCVNARHTAVLVRALAFAASLVASVAACGISLSAASASPSVAQLTSAEVALSHGTLWLTVGWVFAQIATAGALFVLKTQDASLPRSAFSLHGYAALENRLS